LRSAEEVGDVDAALSMPPTPVRASSSKAGMRANALLSERRSKSFASFVSAIRGCSLRIE
jgi:hypothetical protein